MNTVSKEALPLCLTLILRTVLWEGIQDEDLTPLSALIESCEQLVHGGCIQLHQWLAWAACLVDLRQGGHCISHHLQWHMEQLNAISNFSTFQHETNYPCSGTTFKLNRTYTKNTYHVNISKERSLPEYIYTCHNLSFLPSTFPLKEHVPYRISTKQNCPKGKLEIAPTVLARHYSMTTVPWLSYNTNLIS